MYNLGLEIKKKTCVSCSKTKHLPFPFLNRNRGGADWGAVETEGLGGEDGGKTGQDVK